MDIITSVKLHASDLLPGESKQSLICPVCDGGISRKRKFSVTRTPEGILYNCYRASCGTRGFVGTLPASILPERRAQRLRPYVHPIRELNMCEDVEYFDERFELEPKDSIPHIKRTDFDEYLFPIYNLRGLERGYVVRQPWWGGSPVAPRTGREGHPKAKTYPHVTEPMQSFYGPLRRNEPLVVVEDQVSAIKTASLGINTVALLGTTVNADKVREWGQLYPSEVVIALDYDAINCAMRIARKWQLCFNKFRVAMLEQDLKDTPLTDIRWELGL